MTFSYYNGVRKRKTSGRWGLTWSGTNDDEEFSDYGLRLNNSISLDIPEEYTSLKRYLCLSVSLRVKLN